MKEDILGIIGIVAGAIVALGIAAGVVFGVTTSRDADNRERIACVEAGGSYVEGYGPVCIVTDK